jgi:hypothetical protein
VTPLEGDCMNDYPMKLKKELNKPILAKRTQPDELLLKSTEYHLGLSMINFKDKLEEYTRSKTIEETSAGLRKSRYTLQV